MVHVYSGGAICIAIYLGRPDPLRPHRLHTPDTTYTNAKCSNRLNGIRVAHQYLRNRAFYCYRLPRRSTSMKIHLEYSSMFVFIWSGVEVLDARGGGRRTAFTYKDISVLIKTEQ